MPTSIYTLPDGSQVTLVPFPSTPAPKLVEPWVSDSVASITFPFTGQTQRQAASGADTWGMTLTYPPLTVAQAAPLRAWLRQMRGIARGTLIAPPDYLSIIGTPHLAPGGTGEILTAGAFSAGATAISTSGWTANSNGNLLPDDMIQIGTELYTVLDPADADGAGRASFEIWPSLRYGVSFGSVIDFGPGVQGLFCLADNRRNWSVRTPNHTDLSIRLAEYR